ncbi:MAG: cobaltochelatase subunit CobT [Proteobacteria bacterium]|nr:cobaltochelatase subunit CobT [Pseudomonadota bacterium]
MSGREREREREQFLHALEQTTRALSGNPKLKVTLGNSLSEAPTGDVVIPDLPPRATPRDMRLVRGFADRAAFLRRYGGSTLMQTHFARVMPAALKVLSDVEAARAEVMGMRQFPGTGVNLGTLGAMEARAYALRELPDVPLSYLVGLALRQRMGQVLDDVQSELLTHGQERFPHKLKEWVKSAPLALQTEAGRVRAYEELLKILGLAEEEEDPQPSDDSSAQDKDADNSSEGSGDDSDSSPADGESSASEDMQMESSGQDASLDDSEQTEGEESSAGAQPAEGQGGLRTYHAYTTQFDRIAPAREMVTGAELQRLRERYKSVTAGNRRIVSKLAAKLQRYLSATTETGWKLDQEEGLIDPAKLTQAIVKGETYLYRLPGEIKMRDTVVTLLVDNSGSMRGRPIEMAAVSADVLGRTLERCGVGVEVLGFTTQTWKGGQSRLQWIADGSPATPGRLNDLLHVIYKGAEEPYRKAKTNFSVMLADDLLKENIDGESLLWAYKRLLKRKEKRRILIVISDGAPVDYATDKHNEVNYLDRHLREVIIQIERTKQVELLAIGIGHDVRRYYKNAITIDDPSQLGMALVERVVGLFSRRPHKKAS